MPENTREYLTWLTVAAAIVAVVWILATTIGNGVRHAQDNGQRARMACIAQGGTWIQGGSETRSMCILPRG